MYQLCPRHSYINNILLCILNIWNYWFPINLEEKVVYDILEKAKMERVWNNTSASDLEQKLKVEQMRQRDILKGEEFISHGIVLWMNIWWYLFVKSLTIEECCSMNMVSVHALDTPGVGFWFSVLVLMCCTSKRCSVGRGS